MIENKPEDVIGSSPVNELEDLIVSSPVDEKNKLGDIISMDDDDNVIVEDMIEPIEDALDVELTDEQKKELLIQAIKSKNNNFRPTKHPMKTIGTHEVTSPIGTKRQVKDKMLQTNVIVNLFDADYKNARKRKNKLRKISRKANR